MWSRTSPPGGGLLVALATEPAPFAALLAGSEPAVEAAVQRLLIAGALRGEGPDLHAARILAGWPALGVEIDDRTLPQEVRYDQIGGVSYTKGCYTGQETVARHPFPRPHQPRAARTRVASSPVAPTDGRSSLGRRKSARCARRSPWTTATFGLALLRREIEPGCAVVAGGRDATVVTLPFGGEELDD